MADIKTSQREGATVVELAGSIDGSTTAAMQEQVLPLVQPGTHLVVDMANVDFMSSAGLRMMLLLFRSVSAQGGKMVLTGVSEDIKDTMSLTGFLDFLTTADSVEAGLAEVSR